jgi:hypothetical protein
MRRVFLNGLSFWDAVPPGGGHIEVADRPVVVAALRRFIPYPDDFLSPLVQKLGASVDGYVDRGDLIQIIGVLADAADHGDRKARALRLRLLASIGLIEA